MALGRTDERGNLLLPTLSFTHLREAVDGGLAGAVSRVVVEGEEGSRARRADDLAPGAALDHPPGALLRQDERRPHVHLKNRKPQPTEQRKDVGAKGDR